MNPSARKKILIGAGGVVGLLVAAALVAPVLFDANSFKPMIAAEVKKATGRELRLEGPISLSVLPTPAVTANNVVFFNVAGAKNPHMVEIKSVTVKPSVLSLLLGSVEPSSVTLVEPKIVLEINAEGKPNWEFAPSVAEARPASPKPASAKPISLGRLNIENGTLIFSDSKAGLSLVAEKADMSASVGSPEGPFSLNGNATLNGAPLKVDLAVSPKSANGHTMNATLLAGGGKVAFNGTMSELGANARIAGKASASAEQLSEFAATLLGLLGDAPPPPSPLLAGKFSFDGDIEVSPTLVAARDFKLALGQDSGAGSVSVTLKPALAVEARLQVPKLDLDKWLAAAPAAPAPGSAPQPAPPAGAARPPQSPAVPAGLLPADLTVKSSIEIGEVIYNKGSIKNLAFDLDIRNGGIAVPKLTATAPGDLSLQARSAMVGNRVSGEFSLNGPKLRETLAWLDIDTASLPTGKFNRVAVRGKMASQGTSIQVTEAAYELDDIKGTGGVAITLGVPLRIVSNVEIDTLDVDAYLPKPAAGRQPAPVSNATAAPSGRSAAGPSIGLKAKVNKLVYNKETIGGVEVDVALQGSTLRLNDVKVANLAGARLAVRGTIANYSDAAPRPDIAFNFEAPDASRVARLAGASAPENIKQVSASGGLAGSIEQLTLRDVVVNAMGYSVRATGQLGLPGAAKGTPQSASYKGSLSINGQTLEGSVDARLAGRPNITADLKSPGVFDVGKITGASGTAAPARSAPGGGAAPIDSSGMRALDASVKFAAATFVMAPMRISNADLAITLKDGLLTIGHARGALYGGSMNFSGTVDGRKPGIGLDVKGDVQNLQIGELLRGLQGTNQFGGTVKVTVDGKLNAANIALRGAGSTSEQIKSSISGRTDLSGHVFAGADKALTTLGSAATGAVGGAIDNTLGSVLGGVTGNRQPVGVGNLLNAVVLVVNRFVNHNSPIAGHVDIAGGVVTGKDLRVQGQRCTANIATSTNLGSSTTNTTVNFVISEDPSAPYLISTIRGPTSNLSYNVVRGTAKDPPGMVDTLTGGGSRPPAGGGSRPPAGGGQAPAQQQQRSPIPNIPNIFGR
jgi:uncharacterized protein involved in outer membrane biogenesis